MSTMSMVIIEMPKTMLHWTLVAEINNKVGTLLIYFSNNNIPLSNSYLTRFTVQQFKKIKYIIIWNINICYNKKHFILINEWFYGW